jgi:hypothetical protein
MATAATLIAVSKPSDHGILVTLNESKGVDMLNDEKKNPLANWGEENHNHGATEEDAIKARAQEAVQKLDALEEDAISAHLEVGSALQEAKDKLPHGKFGPFLRDDLKKSPSWASLHMRLNGVREDLEPARAWATAITHPLSKSFSVEGLLELVEVYKQRDNAPSSEPRRKSASKVVADKETGARLLHDLELKTDKFVALVLVKADEDFAEVARLHQSTVHSLIEQTCSALQLPRPARDASADTDSVGEKADHVEAA